jgi:hypothetical protein
MSDKPNPIRLELLGEMIRRLQADVRTIRMEAKLHQDTLSRLVEAHTERIATHEAFTQSRLDQMSEVLFAIADKLGVEYRR